MNIEQSKLSKLTWEDVNYIRTHYKFRDKKYNSPFFAKKFGVSQRCICAIVNHRSWKKKEWSHDSGEYHSNHKLNWDKVKIIRESYPKRSMRQLANQFNVNLRTIHNIIHYKTWRENHGDC